MSQKIFLQMDCQSLSLFLFVAAASNCESKLTVISTVTFNKFWSIIDKVDPVWFFYVTLNYYQVQIKLEIYQNKSKRKRCLEKYIH